MSSKEVKRKMNEEQKARMKKKFLALAKRLKKSDPELAKKIEAKVESLVSWYAENERHITVEELTQLLRR